MIIEHWLMKHSLVEEHKEQGTVCLFRLIFLHQCYGIMLMLFVMCGKLRLYFVAAQYLFLTFIIANQVVLQTKYKYVYLSW